MLPTITLYPIPTFTHFQSRQLTRINSTIVYSNVRRVQSSLVAIQCMYTVFFSQQQGFGFTIDTSSYLSRHSIKCLISVYETDNRVQVADLEQLRSRMVQVLGGGFQNYLERSKRAAMDKNYCMIMEVICLKTLTLIRDMT